MEQMLYTVVEASKILKTNTSYVYNLIKLGFLPALKLGSYKVRKNSLEDFLKKYENKDLTDLTNIKEIERSQTNERRRDMNG